MAAVTSGSPSRSSSPELDSFVDLGDKTTQEPIENKASEAVQSTLNGSSSVDGRVSPNLLSRFEEKKTFYTDPAKKQVTFSSDTVFRSEADVQQTSSMAEEDPSSCSRLAEIFCCCFGSSKEKSE